MASILEVISNGINTWDTVYDWQWQEEDKALVAMFESNQHQQGFHSNWDSSSSSEIHQSPSAHPNSSSPEVCTSIDESATRQRAAPAVVAATKTRRKRRRTTNVKNKEEIENQRITHIAVERNRRKQMNEYLAVLRSLMPASYVQRGDQASIVGSAINFVKELEQLVQTMEANKISQVDNNNSVSPPFAEFFTFPQYTTRPTQSMDELIMQDKPHWAVADIEVTMVERHAHIKILTKKRQRQLLNLMALLQGLSLCIQHLNVTTTADHLVLYSVSVKVEEGCHLNTVDEIAAAVNQMLIRIAEDSVFH